MIPVVTMKNSWLVDRDVWVLVVYEYNSATSKTQATGTAFTDLDKAKIAKKGLSYEQQSFLWSDLYSIQFGNSTAILIPALSIPYTTFSELQSFLYPNPQLFKVIDAMINELMANEIGDDLKGM